MYEVKCVNASDGRCSSLFISFSSVSISCIRIVIVSSIMQISRVVIKILLKSIDFFEKVVYN